MTVTAAPVCPWCKGELDPVNGDCFPCLSESETAAENAWLHHAERPDWEAQDEMAREDAMGCT